MARGIDSELGYSYRMTDLQAALDRPFVPR